MDIFRCGLSCVNVNFGRDANLKNVSAYKIILTHVYRHLSALTKTFAPT